LVVVRSNHRSAGRFSTRLNLMGVNARIISAGTVQTGHPFRKISPLTRGSAPPQPDSEADRVATIRLLLPAAHLLG
jgi:hypothetical protein